MLDKTLISVDLKISIINQARIEIKMYKVKGKFRPEILCRNLSILYKQVNPAEILQLMAILGSLHGIKPLKKLKICYKRFLDDVASFLLFIKNEIETRTITKKEQLSYYSFCYEVIF